MTARASWRFAANLHLYVASMNAMIFWRRCGVDHGGWYADVYTENIIDIDAGRARIPIGRA